MEPIIAVIGEEAAIRLVDEFGGRRIPLPKNPRASSRLSRVIGEEAARKIAAQYGWGEFLVPMCAARKRALRDEAILQDARDGMSITKLARKWGVHDRTIRRVRAQAKLHARTRCR